MGADNTFGEENFAPVLELTKEEIELKKKLESTGHTVTDFEAPMTEEQKIEAEKEQAEWIADPTNKQNCLYLAQQIYDLTKGKWITVDSLAKKLRMDTFTVFQKIKICELFGHVGSRIGNPNDGPQKNGKKLFKIIVSNADKIAAINDVIAYHKSEIEKFELEKKIIDGQIMALAEPV